MLFSPIFSFFPLLVSYFHMALYFFLITHTSPSLHNTSFLVQSCPYNLGLKCRILSRFIYLYGIKGLFWGSSFCYILISQWIICFNRNKYFKKYFIWILGKLLKEIGKLTGPIFHSTYTQLPHLHSSKENGSLFSVEIELESSRFRNTWHSKI